jgi:23S rRNA pseudouridine1911/1915/1917 synthase
MDWARMHQLFSGYLGAGCVWPATHDLARCTELSHCIICVLQVTILTGRPHQIRIHMAALGHPLLGDPLYGPGGTPRVS